MSELTKIESFFLPSECDSEFSSADLQGWHERTDRQTGERKQRNTEDNILVNKVYKATTRYNYITRYNNTISYNHTTPYNNTMPQKDIFCFDDSKAEGEYFSLDLNLWEEVTYSIDEQKRINIGRLHAAKDVRLFIQIRKKGELKTVNNMIMFDRSEWAELRRVRGENRGLPLDVNQNGTIWIGDRFLNKDLKIFIRRK